MIQSDSVFNPCEFEKNNRHRHADSFLSVGIAKFVGECKRIQTVHTLFKPFSLNLQGRLVEYTRPVVMGILNITPDSFYAASRVARSDEVKSRAEAMIAAGAGMLDIGGYSSRPGADDVSPEEELQRLGIAMEAVRSIDSNIPVSVDTFRASVARVAVEELGADIINDISGGDLDRAMFDTVADLHVPYVLMHMHGTPSTMQTLTEYPEDDVVAGVLQELAPKVIRLAEMGVADVIVDPGFGFAKTLSQNYDLLARLGVLHSLGKPLLVGMSRKSMIARAAGVEPSEALAGTVAANTVALLQGAAILRVHDVEAARQAVAVVEHTLSNSPLYTRLTS